MPIVRIEVSPPGVRKEEKQQLIAGVTKLLVDVLGKDPKLTHVIITEVQCDDWGFDGKQVSDIINN